MNNYQDSSLWRTAFEPVDDGRFKEERRLFRDQYILLREKVAKLVALIPTDVPGLTIHDITHLDALWETASTVAGDDYPINPAEAYVLGAAILIHDAGMTVASYPQGLSDVKGTSEWKDAIQVQRNLIEELDDEEPVHVSEKMQSIILAKVLRSLHAKGAESLPFITWPNSHGIGEYLIDDSDLRSFYGSVIGKIAASHHTSVTRLQTTLPTSIGAIPKIPNTWTIDPIKLACLLRAADAAHIDERRAPRFLRLIMKPEGVSGIHWNFQSKLAKPRIESDVLVFTSGPEFELSDADAWWLCFDTISMIDDELRGCDVLLEDSIKPRFSAKRVAGAESPRALSSLIKTKGWEPINTAIRVADVPKVVGMLGGSHLYGKNKIVPIRELLQNSSDAIEARRIQEGRFTEYGRVRVWLERQRADWWLYVEDDGIGMSEKTLSGALLDFGNSFWNSEEVGREFPGLISKGMRSVGRFGIGFFSVFMLGDIINVSSQRYDLGKGSTSTLEFRSGLDLRPILRKAAPSEYLLDGGTRVSIKLKTDPFSDEGLLKSFDPKADPNEIIKKILPALCPSMKINISAGPDRNCDPDLCADDWKHIKGEDLLDRIDSKIASSSLIDALSGWPNKKLRGVYGNLVRPLVDDQGTLLGRACIKGSNSYFEKVGIVTIGGFNSDQIAGVAGILIGNPRNAARDAAFPIVSLKILSKWASQQAVLIDRASISSEQKLYAAGVIMQCGGNPGNLPTIRWGYDCPNIVELRELLSTMDSLDVFDGEEVDYDETEDECHPRDFRQSFEPREDIAFLPTSLPPVLLGHGIKWPSCLQDPNKIITYEVRLKSLIEEVWGSLEEWGVDDITVGVVNGYKVKRRITRYVKPGVSPHQGN